MFTTSDVRAATTLAGRLGLEPETVPFWANCPEFRALATVYGLAFRAGAGIRKVRALNKKYLAEGHDPEFLLAVQAVAGKAAGVL